MQRFYFYKRLSFKIVLAFSGLFMLISILFGQYTYSYFKKLLTGSYNKYLFSRAQAVINRTELSPPLIALPDSGESIRVFYHNGRHQPVILFQSPGEIAGVEPPYGRSVIDTLQQYGVYVKKEDVSGQYIELLLTVPAAELDQKLARLRWLTIIGTVLSVSISAGAVYLLTGWLLQPVRTIIAQAKQIKLANLTQRVPVSRTHDELQQLTETFNAMLQRITQEQQQQNAFFAAASHELKTPLAVLQAQTEYFLQQNLTPEISALLISQLQEIKRLQQVVQQFLTTSQLQHGSLTLQLTTIDAGEQLLRVFERSRELLQQKQLKPVLHFDEHSTDYTVQADGDKLDIVWQNLMQNAIKYAPAGTEILVQISREPDHIRISFHNQTAAKAIPVEDMGRAFYRNSTLQSGTGLGLWLCRSVITLHGGQLLIQSSGHQFVVTVFVPFSPGKTANTQIV